MLSLLALLLWPGTDTPDPTPSGGGGLSGRGGTIPSRKTKDFARLIDEAMAEPDKRPAKKRKKQQHVEDAVAVERLLRTLPVIPRPGRAVVSPSRIHVRVTQVKAKGAAKATVIECRTSAIVPHVTSIGRATARTEPAWTTAGVMVVAAYGVHNPTDEELSHIADQLYQMQQQE